MYNSIVIPVVCQACAPTHALMKEEQHNSNLFFFFYQMFN